MSARRTGKRSRPQLEKGKTDWERVRSMTEEDIERAAMDDEDNPPWTDAELEAAELILPSPEPKVPVYIRLDAEIVEHFKRAGPGYQSRINAVLLGYVRSSHLKRKKGR